MDKLRTALLLAVLSLLALPVMLHAEPAEPTIATFSVAAYNPATGEVGVAVQSKFFAVGSVVPWARAGVGAVASQAFGNPTFGERGLELLAAGASPAEAIAIVTRYDADAARRQIGMVSVHGPAAADGAAAGSGQAASYTGAECMAWAGGKSGVTADGIVYAVQGNILTGPEVVDAMAAALEDSAAPAITLTDSEQLALSVDDFAGRLLAALLAGQAAGGDSRGMQSAALLVCQADAGYGGYSDRKYDLRVDDAADPFDELARLLNLARPFALTSEAYLKLYAGDFAYAEAIFRDLIVLQPDEASHHYNLACALSLAGELQAALDELELALAGDELLRQAATEDKDLAPLRELERFKQLVGE